MKKEHVKAFRKLGIEPTPADYDIKEGWLWPIVKLVVIYAWLGAAVALAVRVLSALGCLH